MPTYTGTVHLLSIHFTLGQHRTPKINALDVGKQNTSNHSHTHRHSSRRRKSQGYSVQKELLSLAFTLLTLSHTKNRPQKYIHTCARERPLLSGSTLAVPASAASTVLSSPPTGTASRLILSHWHSEGNAASDTKLERSGKSESSRKTDGNETDAIETRRRSEENSSCNWRYQVQGSIQPTYTFYYPFPFFASFILSEGSFLTTWHLSHFCFVMRSTGR